MEANTEQLDFQLEGALKDMGVTQKFAIRDIMRVYVNNMIKFSFPKNAKEGKGAIDGDLAKVFNSLDNQDVLEYFASRFGVEGASKQGVVKGKKRKATTRQELPGVKFNWNGDQSRMKSWHESHKRNGKVRARTSVSKRVGKFVFYSGMYVPKSKLRAYSRKVYKSIAKFKAGWIPAADWLSSVTGGRSTVPAFARKQAQKRGTYGEWQDGAGVTGVYVINKIPYASKMGAYIIERARLKTVAYSQKATKKQAEAIAARFNATRTGVAT